jgi:hypothetical protein
MEGRLSGGVLFISGFDQPVELFLHDAIDRLCHRR